MHRKSIAGIAAAIALSAGAALAQEQTFNVYGFADASYSQADVAKNHFLYFFVNNDLNFSVDHFNLYFDYKPNQNTRALLEVGFISSTDIQSKFAEDQIITTHFSGIPSALEPALASQGFTSTRTDTARFPEPKKIAVPFIERAYFEALMSSYINFRIGKFLTPAGIWNVDHGSPVILPVKQPYQTSLIPIFPKTQEGAMLFGGGFFGDHDYDYSFYASTGSDPDGNELDGISDLSGGGHVSVHLDLPVNMKLGASGYSGLNRQKKIIGYSDRTIAYSDVSTFNPAFGAPVPDPSKLVPALSNPPSFDAVNYQETTEIQDRSLAYGVDGRFDFKSAFLQTEFNQRITTNELNSSAKDAVLTGYYAVIGYKYPVRENLSLTPYLMYEGLAWEDILGVPTESSFGQLPMEGFDTFLGGVNISIFGNMYVKVEYSYAQMRDLKSPPAIPMMVVDYQDGDTDISTFSTQFAIAF